MTSEQMLDGFKWVYEGFYSVRYIDITAYSETIEYEFKNAAYASEFAKLNARSLS